MTDDQPQRRRFGHDRAYVGVGDGDGHLGYRDLRTGAVVADRH